MEASTQPLVPPLSGVEGQAWYGELYGEHRNAFLKWAQQHYGVEADAAKDAFQEAVVVLYRRAKSGELSALQCSVRTYLFAVGRNHLLNHLRVVKRHTDLNGEADGIPEHLLGTNDVDAQERELIGEQVRQKLDELKSDDRRVLELYYLEGHDMDAVAKALGLKNRNVAKKKKHYALQRLIELVRAAKLMLL